MLRGMMKRSRIDRCISPCGTDSTSRDRPIPLGETNGHLGVREPGTGAVEHNRGRDQGRGLRDTYSGHGKCCRGRTTCSPGWARPSRDQPGHRHSPRHRHPEPDHNRPGPGQARTGHSPPGPGREWALGSSERGGSFAVQDAPRSCRSCYSAIPGLAAPLRSLGPATPAAGLGPRTAGALASAEAAAPSSAGAAAPS